MLNSAWTHRQLQSHAWLRHRPVVGICHILVVPFCPGVAHLPSSCIVSFGCMISDWSHLREPLRPVCQGGSEHVAGAGLMLRLIGRAGADSVV